MQLSSVNLQDLGSGGKGRRIISSHPDRHFHFQISPLQTTLPGRSFLWGQIVGVLWPAKVQLLRQFAGWDKSGLRWSYEA
jgi:hypothetical protein